MVKSYGGECRQAESKVTFVSDGGSRPVSRGHCPRCGPDRNAEVLAEHATKGEDGDFWWKITFLTLRCLGCDHIFIRCVESCSEDERPKDQDPETGEVIYDTRERITYWPSPPTSPIRRSQPLWMWSKFRFKYPQFYELIEELYAALNNNLPTLATIGIRTVFDCAAVLLGASQDQSFSQKLDELIRNNKISREEKEILGTLIDAGSAAAHRGWPPPAPDIESLMNTLENFLQRTFVLKHELRVMKKKIPLRSYKSN